MASRFDDFSIGKQLFYLAPLSCMKYHLLLLLACFALLSSASGAQTNLAKPSAGVRLLPRGDRKASFESSLERGGGKHRGARAKVPLRKRVTIGVLDTSINTIGSYTSGFVLGGAFSGVANAKALFSGALEEWRSKVFKSGNTFGKLGATFTGCHLATKHIRGVDDKTTRYMSACAAGAVMDRHLGVRQMCTSCVTYAGFTYAVENMFGGSSAPKKQRKW
jgi:hypothetical protein